MRGPRKGHGGLFLPVPSSQRKETFVSQGITFNLTKKVHVTLRGKKKTTI